MHKLYNVAAPTVSVDPRLVEVEELCAMESFLPGRGPRCDKSKEDELDALSDPSDDDDEMLADESDGTLECGGGEDEGPPTPKGDASSAASSGDESRPPGSLHSMDLFEPHRR